MGRSAVSRQWAGVRRRTSRYPELMASEALGEAIDELRERVAPELRPLLDALVADPDSAAEDAWRRIVEEALDEERRGDAP